MTENDERHRIESLLAAELPKVDTPETAEAILQEIDRLAAGESQASAADAVPPGAAPSHLLASAAGRQVDSVDQLADVLTTAASGSVGPETDRESLQAATHAVLSQGPGARPLSLRAHRGRRLLREAVLRRMQPYQALDTRVYLWVNEARLPRWLDRLANGVTFVFTGGWVWIGGVAVMRILGVSGSRQALRFVMPCVTISTWAAEYPLKSYFRRGRPFVTIVQALVVGKRPGSWSFPSGHTASSFAAAWALSRVWPRLAPAFLSLAGCVGASRVVVGAHYPGDVLFGGASGILLSEAVRRLVRLLLRVS